MRKVLALIIALAPLMAIAQSYKVPLGTIYNKLSERELNVVANMKDGELVSVEFDCPTLESIPVGIGHGSIEVKAENLPEFRETMGKIRPGMAIFAEMVEENGYEDVSTGFDNVTVKVNYTWTKVLHEKNGSIDINFDYSKGKYHSSLMHKAVNDKDDNFSTTFFLQFRSLYEVDYLLLLMSDENIELSCRKDNLLTKVKNDTGR